MLAEAPLKRTQGRPGNRKTRLTGRFFGNDGHGRRARFPGPGGVDRLHAELVLLSLLEVRHEAVRLSDRVRHRLRPVAALRLHLDDVAGDLAAAVVLRLLPGQSDGVRRDAVDVRNAGRSGRF